MQQSYGAETEQEQVKRSSQFTSIKCEILLLLERQYEDVSVAKQ